MNKRIFLLGLILFLAGQVWAKDEISIDDLKSSFRSVSEIEVPQIIVPTVIEAPLEFENSMFNGVMVIEKESQKTQPTLVLNKNVVAKNNLNAIDSLGSENVNFLVDGNLDNFIEYPASAGGEKKKVEIVFKSNGPVTTSSVSFYLDKFVSLPKNIEVSVVVEGEEKIVLGKKDITGRVVNFPPTTAKEFKIKLEYAQPLRIREISFNQENLNVIKESSVRFLAQPNKQYEIYFNADRYVDAFQGEAPNLNDNQDVALTKKIKSKENSVYKKSDVDKDGVADELDNCVTIENANQEDLNNNGQGDACDDFDKDGVINQKDNCRDLVNRNQEDTDLDGIGNVCDEKENRILQNQKWLPLVMIILVAGVVGILFYKTIKTKN